MRFLAVLLFFCTAAGAQTWPSKPVRVIVNVAAGGVADVTTRVLGARMTETLGQTFLVENRAGGDGYIGFDAVARSSMMIAPHIVNRADLDPMKALVPIAATGRVSLYVARLAMAPRRTSPPKCSIAKRR